MEGGEHPQVGDALLRCGLEAQPDWSPIEGETMDCLFYSDAQHPSPAPGDWIWLHPRVPLKWIDELLNSTGARLIVGGATADTISRDSLTGFEADSWFVQFTLSQPDFDIDVAANILATILRLANLNSEREQRKLRVVALEAITNAWEHGYAKDESKVIQITYEVGPRGMKICVEHEGLGFDVNDVPDPMAPENLFSESGRGILIMRNTLDALDYEEGGRRLVGHKKFRAEA